MTIDMKKFLFSFAFMAMGSVLLTGCLSNDDKSTDINDVEVVITKGALVLCKGNSELNITGSLHYIDLENGNARQLNVNIGKDPSEIYVYGSKVYITCTGEDAVLVLSTRDFTVLEEIDTKEELGEEEGAGPRGLTGYGSKVYVSTNGGYVGVIDTTSIAMTGTPYKVGGKPEGMGVALNSNNVPQLYVANNNGYITTIDLSQGGMTESKPALLHSPSQIAAASFETSTVLFVLDNGQIEEGVQKDAGVYAVSGTNVEKTIPDATGMTAAGQYIVSYNAPLGSTMPSYSLFNVNSYAGYVGFPKGGDTQHPIVEPTAISMDPNTYAVYIGDADGFVNIYTLNGAFDKNYLVGERPVDIAFAYKVAKYSDLVK